jgi:hypothetical protein
MASQSLPNPLTPLAFLTLKDGNHYMTSGCLSIAYLSVSMKYYVVQILAESTTVREGVHMGLAHGGPR